MPPPKSAANLRMDSLLDQSALTALAERLVEAARTGRRRRRRCGCGAFGVAWASKCATARWRNPNARKATMSGLRVFVGRRQAVVSTNDIARRRARLRWPSARSRWRASRPRIHSAGLADPALLAQDHPDLDLLDPEMPVGRSRSKSMRAPAEAAALAVKGVTKSGGASASAGIGGMVLVTSHGFTGAYLGSRSRRLDDGDCRRRHRHGARLRLLVRAACAPISRRRRRSAAPPASARSSGSIRARSRPRKVPVVFDPRVAGSLIGHLAGAINGSAIARKTSFLKDKMGEQMFAPGIRIVDDPLRTRGLRSRPFDAEGVAGQPHGAGRGRRADDLVARQRDRARARPRRPPAMPRAASRPRRRPAPTNLHLEPGKLHAGGADRRHRRGLLRHRPDRHRASTS